MGNEENLLITMISIGVSLNCPCAKIVYKDYREIKKSKQTEISRLTSVRQCIKKLVKMRELSDLRKNDIINSKG